MKKYNDYFYLVFRVLIGLGFLLHGGQKLFGIFGSKGTADLFSLMGLAGVIEFFGGLLIIFGLFTKGINPLTNGGEAAMIYFAAFLVMIAYGSGRISLDKKFRKK